MLLKQRSGLSLGKGDNELLMHLYRKGDEISVLNSEIWQVQHGVVQLSRVQEDGREIISGWVTANGVFGHIGDSNVVCRAIALGDVCAQRYLTHDVLQYPGLARKFLTQFSDRLIKSQHLLAIIAISKVEDRLRYLLSLLKQEIGQSVEDGIRLPVRFTHQHLADAIHTTRVTVTRILGDFHEQDLVYFDSDRHIVIKDLLIADC